MNDYTGVWKLLYDWQTIVAGALAILAAAIGGWMAYRAGSVQAKATRIAADLQVEASNAQLAHLKAEKEEADRRAANDRKTREIQQINIAISALGYNLEVLQHIAHQYIIPHHTDCHRVYTDLRNAIKDPVTAAQFAATIFPAIYPGFVMICPDVHFMEWDFFEKLPFIVEKDPELLKQTGWLMSQSRELTVAIKNRNDLILEARRITTQEGGLKLPALDSILHLQTSIANAECFIAWQLFTLLLDMERKLEKISATYEVPAKKSTMTTKPPLQALISQLQTIVEELPQSASTRGFHEPEKMAFSG
jgi:hypothetical protein